MKHLILKISQTSWNLTPFDCCCTCKEFCAYTTKELELLFKRTIARSRFEFEFHQETILWFGSKYNFNKFLSLDTSKPNLILGSQPTRYFELSHINSYLRSRKGRVVKGFLNNLQSWKLDNSIVIHTLWSHKGLPIDGALVGCWVNPSTIPV